MITTTRSAREPSPTSPRRPSASAFARAYGHEEGAGDRDDREDDRDVVSGAREDERDRSEHRALADAVGGRVEEGAERRRLPAGARERAVEDVEDRADDEDARAEPVEEELVAVLEGDERPPRRGRA